MTDYKIFYSWQSDLPNSTNRGFIQQALEEAIKLIHNDESIEVEPVIDRDTSGVPGSPDIASTIFAKIDQAQVFVCDISIINSGSTSRLTPNPNVLIELGYAIKSLGAERVIMILNTNFGNPENLPFDLRMRRVTTYCIDQNQEKASERRKLSKTLYSALSTIVAEGHKESLNESLPSISIGDQARNAVENNSPNQGILTRKFMGGLVETLQSIAPDFRKNVSDEMIVDAIEKTTELGIEFALLTEAIATMNASDLAMIVYKNFEKIANFYNIPSGFHGEFYRLSFDFYKFIGHEFFVIFISFLIREERWDILNEILNVDLYLDNPYGNGQSGTVAFSHLCSYLQSLEEVRKRRLNSNRISVHADLLNERHTQGKLAEIVPMQQFIDADCFLVLRTELQSSETNGYSRWSTRSLIYLQQTPRYLLEAYKRQNAEKLLKPLKLSNVDTFKEKMIEILPRLERYRDHTFMWGGALGNFDPTLIGTQS